MMTCNPAALQQLARISCQAHPEPWDNANTHVLHEYLSSVFTKAVQQRYALSFHGRVFAKPQMTAISVDARGSDGRTPIGHGIPFANVSFTSRSGSNVVEVNTELGLVTITSRSKALLFASGLLDSSGEPVYCLATSYGKNPGSRNAASKQPWQLNWVLNAEELADKLSPPLNSGREHSRSNVKHRLEPLPIKWQPPTASFFRDAPGNLLALDPRQPIEYSLNMEDQASIAALPALLQQISPSKLQGIIQHGAWR